MDLDFTEEQTMLRDTAQSICQQYYDLPTVRELENSRQGYPEDYWQELVETGITGLTIPEAYGGIGMGLLDAVVVSEEVGKHLASSPLLTSSFMAAKAIELFANEQQKSDWLPAIAEGRAIITVAQLEVDGGYDQAGITLALNNGALNGSKTLVPFASAATHILVLARDGSTGEVVCCLVESHQLSVAMTLQPNIATGCYYKVDLNDCGVQEDHILRAQGDAWQTWQEVMSFVAVIAAAEAAGGAERMLEITAEYSKSRMQFGKAIGAFQSLSHYMAELAVEVEGSKTLNYQAAWAQDTERPWMLLAAQAKLQAGDCYRQTTAVGTQIHGGMGFTTEADPQLYFRRAKSQQLLHWDPEFLELRIAELLLAA